MNYLKRPEPGRHGERVIERIIEKQPIAQSQPIDINALVTAIKQAIQAQSTNIGIPDEFDNSKTLEQLANSMIVQRNKNESNFDNLGNEHHTKTSKKEKKEVQKTIDLLSNLDD